MKELDKEMKKGKRVERERQRERSGEEGKKREGILTAYPLYRDPCSEELDL